VFDFLGLSEKLIYLSTTISGEVRPHSCPQIRCFADVQDFTSSINETVNACRPWKVLGKSKLDRLRVALHFWELL
tara:strand:+ start:815 stop:1039 length:225 start_codon:yes stop_codon:yes gene_type:complete